MFANIFFLFLLVALVHPMVAQENLSDLLSDPATQLSRPADRARVVKRMQEIENTRRQNVRARAALLGLPLRTELPNGRVNEIADFDGDRPLYLSTNNVNAAISSGANLLRTSPYSLTGAGVTIGVWDGGAARSTHLELSGRVTVMDGAAVIDHATHVGGTLIASGIAASARGMAASATVDSYNWTSDISEMTTRGATSANEAGKIYLSNHSYGIISGWNYVNGGSPYRLWEWNGLGSTSTSIETDFGLYNTSARSIDSLAFSTPYYLIFRAAGNDNTDNPANGDSVALTSSGTTVVSYNSASHPAGDGTYRGGFETIGYEALAKNVITIGSAADAVTGGVRDESKAIVSSFSSCGPTDDGRIKPDITANGDGLNSSLGGSDTSYGTYSGTSMATPNACGSAALLIQQFSNLFPGQAMRASTLKGLLIHTADDRGNAGPDYKYGWGLINVKAAADLIQDHYAAPTKIRITESQLTTAIRTRTHSFTWDGVSPIRATLCWTDPAGVALTASDSRSARLVNNLDLKVIAPNGSESFPFVMPFVGTWTTVSMNSSATTGINNTDNTEQVNVSAPAVIGNYQLVVSCPGTVTNGLQNYSILLSGSAPSAPTESTTSLASSVGATGSYSNSVTFTATVSSGASSGTVTFFDGVSILGTGTVNGSGQATYSTTSLALGSHSITAAYGGNVTVAASTSAPLVYTINPKAVTITGVTSSNKIYDGNTTATLSGGTVSGILVGETVTMVAGTGNFDSANAGTRTVTAINYSLGGTHAENYLLASQPTIPSASITPLPIHLTGTRPYDGTSVATNILSAQNNLDGANLIVGGNAYLSGKNVGSRSISIQSPASRVQSTTGTTGVTTSTAINLTLAATPVTGNTLIAVISTRGTTANRVSSITQTGAAWSRATQSTNTNGTTTEIWYAPNVSGAATAITINQASLRSAAVVMEYSGVMTNSSLDKTSTATALSGSAVTGTTEFTSQPDELWIAGIGIADGRRTLNSPYGNAFTVVAFPKSGTTSSDATIYALEKIVNSPGTASSGGTVSLSDNWAGAIATFKALTPTNLTLSGSAAANYTLVGAIGSVTITPRPVELTAVTAIKTYDGTTFAAGTPILSPALISGDTTTSLSQAFQTSNAGIGNKSIIPSVIINDGNAGANYTVTTVNNNTGTINPASATVVLSNMTQTYDGNPKPVTATTSPPGLTTSITYNDSTTAPTSAGTYPVVATITDPNYVGSSSGTLVIQQASQTITFGEIPAATFGDASFALTATSSSGLAVSYSSSNPLVATVTGNTVTLIGAGTTILTASQTGNTNFTAAASVPQLLTVNHASATVTLSNMAQTYDGDPKPVTATTSPPGLTTSIT
ncbi:MAG: S8 family serine peptidase, partial [Akkermansiaceae bacterium]|nr:S8 family serine peptidase [Akkermansiaceae bacterium]